MRLKHRIEGLERISGGRHGIPYSPDYETKDEALGRYGRDRVVAGDELCFIILPVPHTVLDGSN